MSKDIFTPADILIPAEALLEKWSVIACDQFSSQPDYWERVHGNALGAPSAYNLIIPEAYLEQTDEDAKIPEISETMGEYLKSGVFRECKDSLIYVERTQPDGRVRRGLVGAIDLEAYDFSGKDAPIRASEGTVLDRLPARVKIRRAAPLEMPHIITFIDDKKGAVIEPLALKSQELPAVYDFGLMEGGGHITGKIVSGEAARSVMDAMRTLGGESGILMIIGDGNHSLAGAKVYWDELRESLSEAEQESHPARMALVEVCNVYDPAIDFEAIHRVLFDIDAHSFIKTFKSAMPAGSDFVLRWICKESSGEVGIRADCAGDMLVLVQDFIDDYIGKAGCSIDYVHGDAAAEKLARGERSMGLILPAMDKSDIFKTVAIRGVFPRKSFSVGHAEDKRYYLECRKIK